MKIPLTIRQLIWLFIAIVLASFLLAGLIQGIVFFSKTGADWFSALIQAIGNIIGGIIGGIVAIIVATYQVNKAFLNERNKQLQNSSTMLKLVREELRDNITVLASATPYTVAN